MLPVNSSSYQAQLQEKITELTDLEFWGSPAAVLVSDNEIQSILNESFESLKSAPNKSLSFSLLKLADRIKTEEYLGSEIKDLAGQVQEAFGTSSLFPMEKDPTLEVLKKMGIKELSNISRVSHEAKILASEPLITKTIATAQKNGYEGNDFDGATLYLKNLMRTLKGELEKHRFLHLDFSNVENKDLMLEELLNLSTVELIFLCKKTLFYRDKDNKDPFPAIKKFLSANFEIKDPPLEDNIDASGALLIAILFGSEDILKLLLKVGVTPQQIHLEKAVQFEKSNCVTILKEAMSKQKDLANTQPINGQNNPVFKGIIVQAQKNGYEGNDVYEALTYMSNYTKEIKKELENYHLLHFDFSSVENKDLMLDELISLSNKELISLCKQPTFYKDRLYAIDNFPQIRKFLSLNFQIKGSPLGNDPDALEAMHMAVVNGAPEILKLLLEKGVTPQPIDLDNAIRLQQTECIQMLTEVLEKKQNG